MPVRSAPLSHSRSASVDPMKPATPVTRAFITLAARGESPALHRERRGARLARRDDREYREYLREEQRSQVGCSAARMQMELHHGLLGQGGLVLDRRRVRRLSVGVSSLLESELRPGASAGAVRGGGIVEGQDTWFSATGS